MSTPVFRRIANPLSIWIALLAIVLQSVMPMVAQARMHGAVPAVVVAATGHDTHADGQAMPAVNDGSMSTPHADMAGHGAGAHGAVPPLATVGEVHAHAQGHAHTDAGASPLAHAPPNPHAMHGDAPCPYCRVHLDAVALPLLPNPHWVLLVSVVHRAIEVEAIPALPEAWSQTRPRGPPVLS